jgi:hypothetical protein
MGKPIFVFPKTVKAILLWAVKAHLPRGSTTKRTELHIYHKELGGAVAVMLFASGQVQGLIPLGLIFLE